MVELEGLKDQMRVVGTSMANAVSCGTSMINRNYLSFLSGPVFS